VRDFEEEDEEEGDKSKEQRRRNIKEVFVCVCENEK
jgi:hypothetical protein